MSARVMQGRRGKRADQQPDNAGPEGSRAERRSNSAGGLTARLGRAAQAGARQVAENPFAAIAGAAAVSAGIALLLPSTRHEAELMGEVADKLGDVAREAADGVVAAGRAQVENLAQSALAGVGGAVLAVASGNSAETNGVR